MKCDLEPQKESWKVNTISCIILLNFYLHSALLGCQGSKESSYIYKISNCCDPKEWETFGHRSLEVEKWSSQYRKVLIMNITKKQQDEEFKKAWTYFAKNWMASPCIPRMNCSPVETPNICVHFTITPIIFLSTPKMRRRNNPTSQVWNHQLMAVSHHSNWELHTYLEEAFEKVLVHWMPSSLKPVPLEKLLLPAQTWVKIQ